MSQERWRLRWAERLGVAAVVAVVALLSACSSGDEVQLAPELQAEIDQTEAKIIEHEELIAECMSLEGFEYAVEIPPDWLAEKAAIEAVESGHPDPDSVMMAALDAALETPSTQNAYLAALSDEELAAYEAALDGNGLDRLGCYEETYEVAWGEHVFVDDVSPTVARGLEAISTGEALDDYIGCMREHGYEVDGEFAIFEQIDEIYRTHKAELGDTEAAADVYRPIVEAAREAHRGCHEVFSERVLKEREEYLRSDAVQEELRSESG